MKKDDPFDLQVIISSGICNIQKVILGLATALSCAHAGARTVIFLTMEGASFANPNEGTIKYIEQFHSVQDYLTMLLEANVRIEACTACVENYCHTIRDEKGMKKLREGLVYAGLSSAALRALKTKTLVF